jgi:plastocyanin
MGSSDMNPTKTDSSSQDNGVLGSPGTNGVTHTVVVAPTQGVLRFVPFALNASVGDTVKFEWHANGHTVTKGSALELCNKSADADTFASGLHNQSFTYFQVVNDTKPTYYYCAAPNHCQKGMFGIINPPSSADPSLMMAGSMQDIASSDPGVMAARAYTEGLNSTTDAAKSWGSYISLDGVKPENRAAYAANTYYMRALLSLNPGLVGTDGKINMDTSKGLNWPQDVAAASNVAAAAAAAPADSSASSSGSATGTPAASSAGSASASASSATKSNGARGLGVSGAVVAFVAVAASVLAL